MLWILFALSVFSAENTAGNLLSCAPTAHSTETVSTFLEPWPDGLACTLLDTTIFEYKMTCFPDSVGCDTLIAGSDTTIIVTSLAGPISPEGLVAYFPLGTGFGNDSIAQDMSGFGNNGTVQSDTGGINFIQDRCVNAMGAIFFDGADSTQGDFITIPDRIEYHSFSFTVSIWLKKKNDLLSNGVDKILQKGNVGLNSAPRTISLDLKGSAPPWDLQMNSVVIPNDTCNFCNNCICTDLDNNKVNDAVFPDIWYLVTSVVEYAPASNETIRSLYLNGEFKISDVLPGKVAFNTEPFTLGYYPNYPICCRYFNGALDDFRLYNRALSSEEIEKLWLDGCSFCADKYTYNTTCDISLVSANPVIDSMVMGTLYQTVTSFRLPFDISHEGLVAYFPFGENFGDNSTALDMSGFGNHGNTIMGITEFSTDRCLNATGALHFKDDRIRIPHRNIYNTPDFSLSIWFKKDDDTIASVNKIIEKGEWYERPINLEINTHTGVDDGVPSVAPWNLQMNVITCLQQQCGIGSNAYDLRLDSIFPGQWHFVTGTVDYKENIDSTQQFLYFDGLLSDSFMLPGKAQYNNVALSVGNSVGVTSYDFSGDLDEFRLYNRVLSPAEVLQLYQFKPCPQAQAITLCLGDSIMLKNDTYTTPGNYFDIMPTNEGCDSLLIDLTILPLQSSHLDTFVCSNELLIFHGDTIPFPADSVPVVLENMGAFGCDSTVFVTRHNLPVNWQVRTDTLCWEDAIEVNGKGYDRLNPSGMEKMSTWQGCDSTVEVALSFYPQNIFEIFNPICNYDLFYFEDTTCQCSEESIVIISGSPDWRGCDSTVVLHLACKYPSRLDTLPTLCHDQVLVINEHTYSFHDSIRVDTIPNLAGCDSVINVHIHYHICHDSIPDFFTPNGDGYNDTWIIPALVNGRLPANELCILDRFQRVVFSAKPYRNDWEGTGNSGGELPTGSYIYIFNPGNGERAKTGNVTILR